MTRSKNRIPPAIAAAAGAVASAALPAVRDAAKAAVAAATKAVKGKAKRALRGGADKLGGGAASALGLGPTRNGRADGSVTHFVPRSRYSNVRSHSIRIPFDGLGVPLYSSGSAAGIFYFGTTSSGYYGLPLDPNQNVGGYYPFGLNVANISTNFNQWRIVSLQMTWEPAVPTSESAAFVVGYNSDGAANPLVPPSPGNIDSWMGSTLTPSGQRATLSFPYNKGLMYTTAASGGDPALRQDNAGVLFVRGVAFAHSTSLLLGYFQMRGVIEFLDMASQPVLVAPPPPPPSPPENSPFISPACPPAAAHSPPESTSNGGPPLVAPPGFVLVQRA